jgi:hypothetical protein
MPERGQRLQRDHMNKRKFAQKRYKIFCKELLRVPKMER